MFFILRMNGTGINIGEYMHLQIAICEDEKANLD